MGPAMQSQMEHHWRTNGIRTQHRPSLTEQRALAAAQEREANAYAACVSALHSDAMMALSMRDPVLPDARAAANSGKPDRERRPRPAAQLPNVPLLVLTTPSTEAAFPSADQMAAHGARVKKLQRRLEAEGARVVTTLGSGAWTAERLHAAAKGAAAIIVSVDDATVGWLAALGREADVGSRGYSCSSWVGWLARDLPTDQSDASSLASVNEGPQSQPQAPRQRHALRQPRVLPISLQRGSLTSQRRDEASELLGGRGCLSFCDDDADDRGDGGGAGWGGGGENEEAEDGEEAHNDAAAPIRTFDHGVERAGLGPTSSFARAVPKLILSVRVCALKHSLRLPKRYVFLCSSVARTPALRPHVQALKAELRAKLGIHALDASELWLCGDAEQSSTKWCLRHAKRAFATIACLAEPPPTTPPGQASAMLSADPEDWTPATVLTAIREAGALLVPVVLTERRLRRSTMALWGRIKGGRFETYENLGRRVPDPIYLSGEAADNAIERMRSELDQAAEVSHKINEVYHHAKGAGAATGTAGTTALGRSGLSGGGARSRVRVQVWGGGAAGGSQGPSRSMRTSVSLPAISSSAKAVPKGSASRRTVELDWHARQAIAMGVGGRWL